MVILVPESLHWITPDDEGAHDLCLHGTVRFQIDGENLINPGSAPDVTVSVAGLYLLRTLSKDHTRTSPVGEQLFPCCGFPMVEQEDIEDVLILGCPSGLDFEVRHDRDGSFTTIRNDAGREWKVASDSWRKAVFGFADAISRHYAASPARQPSDEADGAGFRRFQAEWKRRGGFEIR